MTKKRIYFAILVSVALLFLFKTRGRQGPSTQLEEQAQQITTHGSTSELTLPKELLKEIRAGKLLVQASKNENKQQSGTISPFSEARVLERIAAESKGWGIEIPALSIQTFMAMSPNQEVVSRCDQSFFENVNRCQPDKCVTTFKTVKGLRSQAKEILGKIDGFCSGIFKVDNYTFYCRSNNYQEVQELLFLLTRAQRFKADQLYKIIKFVNGNCRSYKKM